MSGKHNPFHHHPPLRIYPDRESLDRVSILEIGPGRGDFLFELAERYPDRQIAAIEIKRKRYEKLIRRIERRGLKNIGLVFGDARVALPLLIRRRQLKSIYVLFSDPWPKKRHAKHRLFQATLVHDLYRSLADGGDVVLAHDDARYLEETRALFSEHAAFSETVLNDEEETLLFQTFYAEKWRAEGRQLKAFRMEAKIS